MKHLRKVDQNTIVPEISVAIRKHHFYTLWKRNASEADFFKFVNACRRDLALQEYTWETFYSGWQYRTVLHSNYNVARDEVYNLIFGWW